MLMSFGVGVATIRARVIVAKALGGGFVVAGDAAFACDRELGDIDAG